MNYPTSRLLIFFWFMINYFIYSFPQNFSRSLCRPTFINPLRKSNIGISRFYNTSMQSLMVELEAETIEDMEDIGAVLGIGSKKGDVILLDGDLGAGKTCFSRGFIRAKTGIVDLRVTSPTYLLSNTYAVHEEQVIIHHMDLYRLSEGEDLSPLNLDHVLSECISLIEWPSRLGSSIPSERLEIIIKIDKDYQLAQDNDETVESTRNIFLRPFGQRWEARLQQIQEDGYLDDLIVESELDENDMNKT